MKHFKQRQNIANKPMSGASNTILTVFLLITVFITACDNSSGIDDHFNQAVILAKDGRLDKSISELEKVIEIDPGHAKTHLGLGLLYACKGLPYKALSSLNNGVNLLPDYQPVIDRSVSSILRRYKLIPGEITRKSYDINDISYIQRCIKYNETAINIIRGRKAEQERILALFDWVYRNISIATPGEDYPALPLDLMLRGYGCCDRSAWIFATLAEQIGYHSNIFYLRDPETMVSPHTVALILMNDKWVVFDTYTGIYFRKNGEPAGLKDITEKPSLTHHVPKYREYWSKCFDKGSIWVPVEAEASLHRMQLVQELAGQFLPYSPKIYHNPVRKLLFTLKTLNTKMPSTRRIDLPFKIGNNPIDIWFYPFKLRLHYLSGEFGGSVKKHNPALEYYLNARATFLSGNYQEALEEYAALLEKSPNTDYSDDLSYFKSLCMFELKNWEDASRELTKYLEDYPQGKWKTGGIYHLGRCFEEMGLYEEAIEEFRKIEEIPNVSERLLLLTG